MSDGSKRVDRCIELLADRRRRFCLYHLHRADRPIALRDLAALVEASVTPVEASLTERLLEEAVVRLHHSHLPKLRDAGLVAVNDGYVELTPKPPIPIQEWLSAIAAEELDSAGAHEHRRERSPWRARTLDGVR